MELSNQTPGVVNVLDGFVSISDLRGTGALMGCSAQSYRHQWRKNQKALVEAEAVVFIRGRLMIHPQRFASVVERQAVSATRARVQRQP